MLTHYYERTVTFFHVFRLIVCESDIIIYISENINGMVKKGFLALNVSNVS